MDIQTQIKRLSTLTNDLIYLSRMEEEQGRQQFLPLPFSELVAEAAQAFQAVAKRQNKTLSVDVQPMLTLVGEEKSLVQLVSILLDNALKYSPEGGQIALRLSRQGKHLRLSVENTAEVLSKELLENMFGPVLPGGCLSKLRPGGIWHRAVHCKGRWSKPTGEALRRGQRDGPPGDYGAVSQRVKSMTSPVRGKRGAVPGLGGPEPRLFEGAHLPVGRRRDRK